MSHILTTVHKKIIKRKKINGFDTVPLNWQMWQDNKMIRNGVKCVAFEAGQRY